MDDRTGCIPQKTLAAYCDGLLSAEEIGVCEGHLKDCGNCRSLVEIWAQAADRFSFPGEAPAPLPMAWRPAMRWAAAAAVLLGAGGVAWSASRGPGPVRGTIEIAAAPGAGAPAPAARPVGLGDWVEVPAPSILRIEGAGIARLSAGARIRVRSARDEGRVVLDLDLGDAHVVGEGGARGFRIETPAATVREIGTEYAVRVLPLERGDGRGVAGPGVVVRVLAGEVRLENEDGACRLLPGHVGCAVRGHAPEFLEGARGAAADALALDRLRSLAAGGTGVER